ncbi:MAG: HlyD family efflux transporter periplasmic adaptor subunit [Planctomycetes bacterium]|nr:HlyD family efflux transporter periplasmic adaptor subunit [Planctomycetota bacterium]
MRMRPDLLIQRQRHRGQVYWVIKDPVALRYYRLRDEEHEVLRMLDGAASLDSIRSRFEEAFAPQRLDPKRLQAFLGKLHRQGLILAETPGQGRELFSQHAAWRRQRLLGALSSVLAIRFRGIDPEPLLQRVYPRVRWLFSPAWLGGCTLLVLAALLLVTVNFDSLWSKLPALEQFFSLSNAAWLAVALMFSKVLHELGHALVCKHLGGECHEMGVLLLAGIPCLYCDVSDAWMIPDKWRRAAIGAAGMAVEVVLAAVCSMLWWFSQPGLLNSLCFALLISCSVSTLLLNGNPLLRYDGYYILSDLLEVPNLWQRSRDALKQLLLRLALGIPEPPAAAHAGPERLLLASYAALSIAYGWFVLLAILWLIHRALRVQRLDVLGTILAGLVLAGILAPAGWRAVRFVQSPVRMRQARRSRAALFLAIVGLLLAAVLLVPLPQRITAEMIVQPRDAQRVYVSVPGVLESVAVRPGERVAVGQTLAALTNREVDLDVVRLEGQRRLQQTQLRNLHRERISDPSAGARIPQTEEALQQVERQLQQRQEDRSRLTIVAPTAGAVLPPIRALLSDDTSPDARKAAESPLEQSSLGSFLPIGATFCLIGDPRRWEAVLAIGQADIELVRPGQKVAVQLAELPGETFAGEVLEIAEVDVQLGRRTDGPQEFDEFGGPTPAPEVAPAETLYRARVSLDPGSHRVLQGFHGRAKVKVAAETLAGRLLRAVRQTLREG